MSAPSAAPFPAFRGSSLRTHFDLPPKQSEPEAEIALLNRIASRISLAPGIQEILADVVEFVTSVVQCDSCFIYVRDGDDLVLRASRNPHRGVTERLKGKLRHGITGSMTDKEPVGIGKGAYNDPRFKLFTELPEDRFEAFLSVPLISARKLVGIINVQNRAEHSYSAREIMLVTTLGYLVGSEIDRAHLEHENSQLADQLESRKMIERAKGILQRDLKISEEDAYLTLQRESRARRKSMKEVASAIILADSLKRTR